MSDAESKIFAKDLGQSALVERSTIENERMKELRGVLSDIGRDLERIGAVPKGMKYLGSLSVHTYASEALGTVIYATVSELGGLNFPLADGALRELTGTTAESFGQKRQKLRSGF